MLRCVEEKCIGAVSVVCAEHWQVVMPIPSRIRHCITIGSLIEVTDRNL